MKIKVAAFGQFGVYDCAIKKVVDDGNGYHDWQFPIGDGWYVRDILLRSLCQFINLEVSGVYDYAVPQPWFVAHEKEIRARNGAIWFYPNDPKKASHVIGEPVFIDTLFNQYKELVHEMIMGGAAEYHEMDVK